MRGFLPDRVHAEDPEISFPEAPQARSPSSLDRSATLRWLVGATAYLGIFWTVSHHTDRLSRLYLIWGLVITGFLFNVTLAAVQVTNRSEGLYGVIVPGNGPAWGPSYNDLLEAPGIAVLRSLPATKPADRHSARAILIPAVPFLFGTMMGGAGGFLALGTMAIPLAMAIILHLVSPRGSRESLSTRLGHAGQGSLVFLLVLLLFMSSILIGLITSPWHCLPLVIGLVVVVLPALLRPGARWPALGLTIVLLIGLGLGTAQRNSWPDMVGGQAPIRPPDLETMRVVWTETSEILREFPLIGSGLGSFATIHPYFKDRDPSPTTAMSSLLQWGAETGIAGLGVLALGLLWCLVRLPAGLKRVGTIDRSLAHGLIGAAVSFSLLAVIHWTVELTAVAISVSALGGTWNRWLAGGTDLFIDRA
jgi:hypothetical protein